MSRWIKNYDKLATTTDRKIVLDLIEAAYSSIDTETVIRSQVRYDGHILAVKNQSFDLDKFKRVFVIGFGKASCKAAFVLDSILGSRIDDGVAIGLQPLKCEYIRSYHGSHPQPTAENVQHAQEIVDIANKLNENDLVITIVSGGGSSLLCYPMSECEASQKLYESFLKTGGNITELNTVRKHISHLKGGGLAKMLYPASVIGLIFSDLPGNGYDMIASGPTYKDASTIADAQQIVDKYNLGQFELVETPKEDQYFEKVVNIPLVSNITALETMKQSALELGIETKVLTAQMYDEPSEALDKLIEASKNHHLVLAGGEPSIKVTKSGGTGGRNAYVGLTMLKKIQDGMVFASVASDGLDNGPVAGSLVDYSDAKKADPAQIDAHLADFDSLGAFEKFAIEPLLTGPTEANVSDLLILYKK